MADEQQRVGGPVESFSPGPSLDYELAMSRVGGDVELLKELAQLFLEEYPRMMQELRTSLERGDVKQVERAAHGLKGSAANFGARRAVEAAYQIEQLGRSGNLNTVPELIHSLDLGLLALHADLVRL